MKSIAVLLLVLVAIVANGCIQEEDRTNSPQFKGMELYSYVGDEGAVRYALLVGTNREKSADEIVQSSVSYAELLRKIEELAPEENILWTNDRPDNMILEYPDKPTMERIESLCRELGISLHLSLERE